MRISENPLLVKDKSVLGYITKEEERSRKVEIRADTSKLAPGATQNLQTLTGGFKERVTFRETLTEKEKVELAKKARQLSAAAVQRFRYTEPYIRIHQALQVRPVFSKIQ